MTNSEDDKLGKASQDSKKNRRNFASSNSYSSDSAYNRLEILLEVSQILAQFDSVAGTFPKILNLVSETFPIVGVVLIENRSGEPLTNFWRTSDFSVEQLTKTLEKAKDSFSYFVKSTPDEISELNRRPVNAIATLDGKQNAASGKHFLVLPLVVGVIPVFGVLQFEAREAIREKDVKFANALANLIAVVLDRHYRIQNERQNERQITDSSEKQMRGERDDTRELMKILEDERGLREKFVQTLSHDLRTPLATIHMCGQFLARSTTLLPDDVEMVKKILRNANRLGQMIDSLLDANRLQAGEKLPLDLEECDFSAILHEVVGDLNELADGAITFNCTEKIIGNWDQNALRRLSENLIGNAIKYRQPATPIEVRIQKKATRALLSVHNLGNPIRPQDQETLFHQFRRTRQAQQSGKAGWGIGLTLVKGISEAHGGRVWVESNALSGTTFWVEIPTDPSRETAVDDASDSSVSQGATT